LGGLGDELNTRILRIQKRAIRSVVGVSSRTSCRQLFKELKILTLASLYILEVTCFIRKYCQSQELNSSVQNYNTRRKMYTHIQSYKTDIYIYKECCPCHHGMAHPQVADGGTTSDLGGRCE
jgi:hypothetical protein